MALINAFPGGAALEPLSPAAGSSEILAGYKSYNEDSEVVTGSIAQRSAGDTLLTFNGASRTFSSGYYPNRWSVTAQVSAEEERLSSGSAESTFTPEGYLISSVVLVPSAVKNYVSISPSSGGSSITFNAGDYAGRAGVWIIATKNGTSTNISRNAYTLCAGFRSDKSGGLAYMFSVYGNNSAVQIFTQTGDTYTMTISGTTATVTAPSGKPFPGGALSSNLTAYFFELESGV